MNPQQGGELGVGAAVDPLTGRPPPPQQPAPRRARFSWKALIVAVLVAAALVVTVIALIVIRPTPAAIPASAPITTTPASAQPEDTTTADRALCTAIAPLMSEINRISNTYLGLGDAGTPARDSTLPKFISDVQDWIGRVQPILDQHPDARPFFRRSLQRFIDDRNLLVSDLKPGPLSTYAYALWSDSLGAYGGPLHICEQLGVKW
jgi:hypothetical protein